MSEEQEVIFEEKTEKPKRGRKPKATKPNWRPSSQMGTLRARPGFTARWVHADPANIAKKKAERWVIMKPKDNVGEEIIQTDVNDANALHDGIRYRDHIAMMLSDEDKTAREEYHGQENREAMASVLNKSDEQLRKGGVKTYTPKGQSGRIVID